MRKIVQIATSSFEWQDSSVTNVIALCSDGTVFKAEVMYGCDTVWEELPPIPQITEPLNTVQFDYKPVCPSCVKAVMTAALEGTYDD